MKENQKRQVMIDPIIDDGITFPPFLPPTIMELLLPEELLQTVAECLAFDTPFVERQLPVLRWKYSITELLSLSLVNHQLRRISMPFLFAFIRIKANSTDVERLIDRCVSNKTFAASIRSLCLNENLPKVVLTEAEVKKVDCLLQHLTNLSQIGLGWVSLDKPLLAVINRHPVPTVILIERRIHGMLMRNAHELGISDLSKMVIAYELIMDYDEGDHPLKDFLACGMQVLHAKVKSSKPSLGVLKLNGLRQLTLNLDTIGESLNATLLSWLPELTRSHQLLKKIQFITGHRWKWRNHPTPFVQPLVDAASDEGLGGTLSDWLVTGLDLSIHNQSLGPLLRLVHGLFPQIYALSLNVVSTTFDELVTALCPLFSLRVVDLVRPFDLLGFGNSFPEAAEIEAAIIQYTSRIAQRIPTIEAFHIDYLVTLGRNYFYGWLNVQQTLHGRHT
ncbi:hypothetical protein BT96DRAFT_1022412 [Gymnopus androsaceus JB14]|uniref:Uncharacterized protein n=1 Tax=Gymnopus androsaceus JB14 TaxID=1447944 RepID=A0A6A4HBP2_9AGAR|nr:hypothetical protein BT96DRAFT_1022412 [Gymnopus androsaceus JB14]